MKKAAKITAASLTAAAAVGLGVYVFSLNKGEKAVPTVETVQEENTLPATEPVTEFVLPANWSDNMEYVPSNHGITAKARAMNKVNPDYIAWMKIDGTPVDYPIVLDPGEIEENDAYHGIENVGQTYYYLYRELNKEYKFAGTLFMDYRTMLNANKDEQSENLIIHGHDMLDESMFGSFRRYRNEPGFYDRCSFIELETKYDKTDYVIFAYLPVKGVYEDNGFNYWDKIELDTKEQFDSYVNTCKGGAYLDTGIDVQFGDKLITMSTCFERQDDMRFIVVARSLREGENIDDISSIAHTQEWLDQQKAKAEEESRAAAEAASAT